MVSQPPVVFSAASGAATAYTNPMGPVAASATMSPSGWKPGSRSTFSVNQSVATASWGVATAVSALRASASPGRWVRWVMVVGSPLPLRRFGLGQRDGGRTAGAGATGGQLGVVIVDIAEAVSLTAGEGLSADGLVPDLAGLPADGHVGIGDVPLGVLPVLGVVQLLGAVPAPAVAGTGVLFPAGQPGQEAGTLGQQAGLLVIGVDTVPPVREDQLGPDLPDVPGQARGNLLGAVQESVGEVLVHDRFGADGLGEGVGFGDLLPLVFGDRHRGVAPFAGGEGEQYGAPAVQGVLREHRT